MTVTIIEKISSDGGGAGVTNGYYYNGVFYKDVEHTELIEPKEGGLYYDISSGSLFIFNGVAYVPVGGSVDYMTVVDGVVCAVYEEEN